MPEPKEYLLAGGAAELERLQLQARVWEPEAEVMLDMIGLPRPGGTIAIQEPVAASWNSYPPHPSWKKVKEIILATFSAGGGDFNAGTRTFGMLRRASLGDVRIRAAVIALQDKHPYMRSPVQFATSLRKRIVEGKLATEAELDRLMAECEEIVNDPDRFSLTFTVTQVW